MTVADRFSILRAADEAPDAPALIDEDGALDFRGLRDAVLGVLGGLGALDAQRERAWLVPTLDRESIVRLLAAIELGLPVVLGHPRWTPAELQRARAKACPSIDLRGVSLTRSSGPRPSLRPPPPQADRTLAMVFTSGTSGTPRAAVLSRRALLAAADASAEVLGWRDEDRWLLAMPLAHVGGLSIVLRCLAARRAVVLHRGPIDGPSLAATVRGSRVTLASLVPTMLSRVVDDPQGISAPSSLRAVLLGGAACPPALLRRGAELGFPLRPTYGLTEMCAQVATLRRNATGGAHEGVGLPLPGVELALRERRLWVRGPMLFDGFLEEPDPRNEDGYYDTGDDARLGAEGHLFLLGRRSDLIVTGGENVYPREVELALEAVPGIEAACVFGVPDPKWGELVCAACVANERPSLPTLRQALGETLSAFKHPRRVAWVESLVIAPSGKLDRRATAQKALERLEVLAP